MVPVQLQIPLTSYTSSLIHCTKFSSGPLKEFLMQSIWLPILYKPGLESSSVVIPWSSCFYLPWNSSDRTIRISQVPELRTVLVFFSGPIRKMANWVSWTCCHYRSSYRKSCLCGSFSIYLSGNCTGFNGRSNFFKREFDFIKDISEKPLVLILVNIEVPAMVVSLTISPVRRNTNIDGMKRKEELFSDYFQACVRQTI